MKLSLLLLLSLLAFGAAYGQPTRTSSVQIISGGEIRMDGDSLGTVADLNPLKTQLAEIFQKGSRQVTVESANSADFSDVLRVLRTVRDLGAKPLSLKVAGADGNFMVTIPISADADEDIVKLRPNPLTLVVRVAADHRLYLNGELQKSQPALLARLRQIFRQRKEMKVYRPGSNEIEATLFLKPYPDLSFAAVIELLGALHRVGADPLGLQVDDLGDGYTSVLRSGLPLGPKTDAFFNRMTKLKQQLPPAQPARKIHFHLPISTGMASVIVKTSSSFGRFSLSAYGLVVRQWLRKSILTWMAASRRKIGKHFSVCGNPVKLK